jgi:PAS domain S-box-containing protein
MGTKFNTTTKIEVEKKHKPFCKEKGRIDFRFLEAKELFDAFPFYVMLIDENHHILMANEAVKKDLGVSPAEIIGEYCPKVIHGLNKPYPGCPLEEAIKKGRAVEKELFLSELERWVKSVVYPTKFSTQKGGRVFIHTIYNITKRKVTEKRLREVNRVLRVLSECNNALVQATNETKLLQEVCKIIVKAGGYHLAWIGYAQSDKKKTVRPVAQAGFEKGYLKTVNITWSDTGRGHGPTGTAVRTGRPSICRSILTSPEYAPWRSEARKRGYASSIAPL